MSESQLFTLGAGILGNLLGLGLLRFAWILSDDPHRWNRRSWAVATAPWIVQLLLEMTFHRWSRGGMDFLNFVFPAIVAGMLSAALGILHAHLPDSSPRALRLALIGILAAALLWSLWPLPRHGWI